MEQIMTKKKSRLMMMDIFHDYLTTIQNEVTRLKKEKDMNCTVEFEKTKVYKSMKGYDISLIAKLRKKK